MKIALKPRNIRALRNAVKSSLKRHAYGWSKRNPLGRTVTTHAEITHVARSPGLDTGSVDTVVILPTYKRPGHLIDTLNSLAAQTTARRFAVIVMDNDADGLEGASAAKARFEESQTQGLLIVAHERGNCSAYNAGFDTALDQFPNATRVAIIDDDELADPDWLDRLCGAAEQLGADIVGGPQVPVFENAADDSLRSHPVFAPPYDSTGRVGALYSSGNLIIGRNVLKAFGYPFLDTRFNFLGGGDSDFLSRAAQRGFTLGWCAEAVVRETIPARRLEWDWVKARALRNGVISTLVEKKRRADDPLGALKRIAKSVALLAASPLRAIPRIAESRSLRIGLYPVHIAAGRLLAEFGYAHEQYRHAEKN
ncbi:MAG: glycosyltransferase family 2 protein [Brucellaceae bacterium]|nr:glycosyltransferase family 2 protein [Brucellaceae bacterium]